ncbi:transposable element Tcb2 transposase [Trichonephila clavipes]|nr:transposable element Tcb2 transposase [Trichonephila clavipes]
MWKNHTIGEDLIKPSISAFLKIVLEKDDNTVKAMPLSNSRRTDEMSDDIETQLVEKLKSRYLSLQMDESTLRDSEVVLLACTRYIDKDQFCKYEWINTNPKILCPEDLFQADHELQHLRRPFSSSFGTKEKNHYCAAARCRPLSSIRKKNLRYYGAKSSSQCRASTDLEEQRTRYHQSNTVERHSYRGGGILVWAGISLGGHTDLHVFHGGTVTGLRYRDEILDPYVHPYAAAIGDDFILMDDNARPHRARIVEEYLEDHGLERMEGPARSPDLNPIEHLWDYLGREVGALNPPQGRYMS